MESGVYIVGTPIGNLDDISPRALAALRGADVIFAEDTRHTLKLMARFGIRGPLVSCHKFNEASRVRMAMERLRAGARLALVTSAGMPGVSDPGPRIVDACRKLGVRVTVLPGPSSVTAAAALCGFAGRGYHFEGFLPRKPGRRRRRLAELSEERCPVIFFESPFRIAALLGEMSEAFGNRRAFVGRELTKLNEECLWGTPGELRAELESRTGLQGRRKLKGECVIAIEGAGTAQDMDED